MPGLTDADTGFSGGIHSALSVDLGFLAATNPGDNFISHFTIGCGNDNLMRGGNVSVPAPAANLLIGLDLLSVWGFPPRKHIFKQA